MFWANQNKQQFYEKIQNSWIQDWMFDLMNKFFFETRMFVSRPEILCLSHLSICSVLVTILVHFSIVLFLFYCLYSVVNVESVFTEAQPGSTLTALCFEITEKIQIFPHQNYEPMEIKCNFQQPSSSDSSLLIIGTLE